MSRSRSVVLALLLAVVLVGAGCSKKSSVETDPEASGNSSQCMNVRAPKTKFVLHGGLAFGAFHRYIYKPYKEGAFQAGTPGRGRALVKAGLAGAFTYHEARKAACAAQSVPSLQRFAASFSSLGDRIRGLGDSVKAGRVDASAIEGANGSVESLRSDSSRAGADIKDRDVPTL